MPWWAARVLALAALAATPVSAQVVVPDADLRAAAFNPIAPNGTYQGQPAYLVNTRMAPLTGNHRIQGTLVLQAGGEMVFEDAVVEVDGDVYLENGGKLKLVDTDFSVLNVSGSRTYNYYWRGGHLDTRRTLIGGRRETRRIANFFLHRGLWTCRDTTVHYSGGILVGEHEFPTELQAGRLIADGLYPGEVPDAVRMNASGHATLRNSRFAISVRLFDPGTPTAGPIRFDCNDRLIVHEVYGDASFHNPAANPAATFVNIPGSPWRLELENVVVSLWALQFFDMTPSSTPRTYELLNANRVDIGLHADDLTGTPQLIGGWSTFYSTLPGLPTATAPGQHGMPPGCGVRVGNVTLMSPPNAWSYIKFWNLYLRGGQTNFAVRGPMNIGEAFVEAGTLTLEGTEGYDAACEAVTASVYETGNLVLRDMTLGTPRTRPGELEVTGRGTATVERCRVRRLTVRAGPQRLTGPNQGVSMASVILRDVIQSPDPRERLDLVPQPGSTITWTRAAPNQSFDLQNLDFESAVQTSGEPGYWSAANASGSSSTDLSPASTGSSSFECSFSGGSGGSLYKRLQVAPGALVELYGWVKVVSGSPSSVQLTVRDSATGVVSASPTTSGQWEFVTVPAFVVPGGTQYLELAVEGRGATVRLDDFVVRFPEFWEDDNLRNLGFEVDRRRNFGVYPQEFNPMDYWDILNATTAVETVDLAPSTTGTQAARLTVACDSGGTLRKRLRFVRAGQTVTVTGSIKGLAADPNQAPNRIEAYLGEANVYFSNGASQWWNTGTGWQPVDLTWTAPANTAFTTLAFRGTGLGDELLIDDLQVTIQ